MGGAAGGVEIWAFWAKVVERSEAGRWGGFEARAEMDGMVGDDRGGAKGFVVFD